MKYIAKFEIFLSSAIKEIADFENRVNEYMSKLGYDEKLRISTKIFNVEVSVEKELTEEEQYKIEKILTANIIKSMPKYDIRLKSFSRQSEQLVKQLAE